jgi:hypothetical protein
MMILMLSSLSNGIAWAEQLVVADFDTGDKPNNLGGDFGAWARDPDDDTQFAEATFVEDDALGDPSGFAMRLDYDVDSPNAAYGGFWMKLSGLDVRDYNTLSFYVQGDVKAGYTRRVKIELKDYKGKTSAYVLEEITEEWQRVHIPFSKFREIDDWGRLNELVIVFDDTLSDPKVGAIYVDQIAFIQD